LVYISRLNEWLRSITFEGRQGDISVWIDDKKNHFQLETNIHQFSQLLVSYSDCAFNCSRICCKHCAVITPHKFAVAPLRFDRLFENSDSSVARSPFNCSLTSSLFSLASISSCLYYSNSNDLATLPMVGILLLMVAFGSSLSRRMGARSSGCLMCVNTY